MSFLITVRTEYVRLAAACVADDGSDERIDKTTLCSFRPPRPYSKRRRVASALGTTNCEVDVEGAFGVVDKTDRGEEALICRCPCKCPNIIQRTSLNSEAATRANECSGPTFPILRDVLLVNFLFSHLDLSGEVMCSSELGEKCPWALGLLHHSTLGSVQQLRFRNQHPPKCMVRF